MNGFYYDLENSGFSGQRESFSFLELGNTLGDTVTSAVDYVGSALDANAVAAMATAKLNAAQADGIVEASKRKTAVAAMVGKIVIAVAFMVMVVIVFKK